MKNVNLFNASLHLYQAATFLGEIDPDTKSYLLDLSKKYLDQVEITEESEQTRKEILAYSKEIGEKHE